MFTDLGQVVVTRGIYEDMEQSATFYGEITAALLRYQLEDWGDALPPEDAELNDESIKEGGRILAAYNTSCGRIWIITEWDRSVTTVLYPSEY